MKNKTVTFKVTEEFYNMLQFKALSCNMKISNFIRVSINNINIKVNNDRDIGSLIGSINKVGNNINQIAYNLNIANNENKLSDVDYDNLLDKLTIIEHQILELSESV